MLACNGILIEDESVDLYIDLTQEKRIRVIGTDETTGRRKEYFLKVTERKGLVLV